MWASLTDKLPNLPMGVTAENLAEKYSLTREEVDAFALRSQTTWGKANEAGVFKVGRSHGFRYNVQSVGGSPKSRRKEQNQLICDSDMGGGVKKSENFADVI